MANDLKDPYIVAVGYAFQKFAEDVLGSSDGSSPASKTDSCRDPIAHEGGIVESSASSAIPRKDRVDSEKGTRGLIQGLDAVNKPGVSKRLAVPPLGPDHRIYSAVHLDEALAQNVASLSW